MSVLAGAVVSGCQGSKLTPPVACTVFASAQELCDVQHCDPTWTAVETNRAYCDRCTYQSWSAGDCGDFHVLDVVNVDTARATTIGATAGPLSMPSSSARRTAAAASSWARRRSRP